MKPTLPLALLAAVVLALLVLGACHSTHASNTPAKGELAFQTLRRGYQSGARTPQCSVITSADAWSAWWKMHASLSLPTPELPAVDFAQSSVLVLSLGNRPSAGYGVEILRVTEKDATLVVEAKETAPAKDMLHPQIVTQPYHIVMLPRTSSKPVLVMDP